MLKTLIQDNAWNIGVLLIAVVGAYFTIQSNSEEIDSLKEKIEEIEQNKVSKSTLRLKEQFLQSELATIRTDITHMDVRLDKKIKIINEHGEDLDCVAQDVAVHSQRLKQNEGELDGLWKFTNKFLEKL